MQIETVCAQSLEAPSYVIAILVAINQQKVDNFKPVYLGNYLLPTLAKKSLCFLNMLLTTFTMVIFIYFALDKIFFFFFSSITISPLKPQTAHGSNYELLQISKSTGTRLKSGVPRWRSSKRVLQNLNFFIFKARPMKF